jgi:effector-binding domain-containing protein
MPKDGEIINRDTVSTIIIRTKTTYKDLPDTIGASYGKILEYLKELETEPAGAPFVAYFNMDMEKLEVGIGFPVSKSLPRKDDLRSMDIPRGKYASYVFTGPYSEIKKGFGILTEWVKENDLNPSKEVAYEIYLNDPGEVPPEKLETQILFPLI